MVEFNEKVREEEKEERKKKQRIVVAQDKADVVHVMESGPGRRFVSKLLQRAGVNASSFTGKSNSTFFKEGGRNQGLMLLDDIKKFTPGSYLTMIKEEMNND